jgi:hypothetical protein
MRDRLPTGRSWQFTFECHAAAGPEPGRFVQNDFRVNSRLVVNLGNDTALPVFKDKTAYLNPGSEANAYADPVLLPPDSI